MTPTDTKYLNLFAKITPLPKYHTYTDLRHFQSNLPLAWHALESTKWPTRLQTKLERHFCYWMNWGWQPFYSGNFQNRRKKIWNLDKVDEMENDGFEWFQMGLKRPSKRPKYELCIKNSKNNPNLWANNINNFFTFFSVSKQKY